MTGEQISMFDLLAAPAPQTARAGSAARPFRFSASAHAQGFGFYCFGSVKETVSDGFTPGGRYMVERFPTLVYYLKNKYLDPADIIDLYGHETGADGKPLRATPDEHLTFTAAELYAALRTSSAPFGGTFPSEGKA